MREVLDALPLDDNSIRLEFRRLHSAGVWNVEHDVVPTLAAFGPVATRIARYSHEALRAALSELLDQASDKMSDRDRDLVVLLFGLPPYESMGPRLRHQALPDLAGQPWSQFRSSPFDNLLTRLIQALNSLAASGGATVPSPFGYRVLSLQQEYVEPTAARPILSILERRRLKVEARELPAWIMSYRLQLVSAVGPPSVRHSGSGRFTVNTVELSDQQGDGFELEFRIDFIRPPTYGDEVEFTLIKDTPVDIDAYRRSPGTFHTGFAPMMAMDQLEIAVSFDPAHNPKTLRKVTDATPSMRLRDDIDEIEWLDLPTDNFVKEVWTNVQWQKWSGLVWL